MITWRFKPAFLALGVLCALPGCAGEQPKLGFLQPFETLSQKAAGQNHALKRAQMARGAANLVPPDGFCIDRRTLKQNFALLARCDVLGARGGAADARLGVITVSVSLPKAGADPDLKTVLADLSVDATMQLVTKTEEGLALALLEGPVPEGAGKRHWRGVGRIGATIVGLAVYSKDGSALAGEKGADLLRSLMTRSQAATVSRDVADTTETEQKRRGLGSMLRNIFE